MTDGSCPGEENEAPVGFLGRIAATREKVLGPNDLLDLVAGFHHFGDLLR